MADGKIRFEASADFAEAVRKHLELKKQVKGLADAYQVEERDIRAAHRAMVAEEKATARSAKTKATLTSSVKAMRAAYLPAVAAVTAMGAAVFTTTKRMSEMVDQFNLMAESSGLTVKTVIAIERALEGQGSSLQKVQGGLNEFSRRIADAATKGGEAAKVFDEWGLVYTDLDGTIRDTNEVFRDALRIIERLEDPTDRAAARLQIFGNEAARAMAALDPTTLATAEAQTSELADAIDRAQTHSAAWDAAMAELNTSVKTFTADVGSTFAADIVTITEAVAAAVKTTGEWSGAIYEASQWLRWSNPIGVLAGKTIWNIAGGYEEATAQVTAATDALKDYGEQIGLTAPRTPGVKKGRQGRLGKSQAEIEAEQDEREGARQERLKAKRDRDKEDKQRKEDRDARARKVAEDRAAKERMRQIEEEARRTEWLRDIRFQAAEAGISAFVDVAAAAGASKGTLWALQKAEALGYQAVAMARAMAEGGLIAGVPGALGMAGLIGVAIAEATTAQTRHMGGGAPDEGLVTVRNNEVIRTPSDLQRESRGSPPVVIVPIDEMMYAAADTRHGRRHGLYGDRLGRAIPIGHS